MQRASQDISPFSPSAWTFMALEMVRPRALKQAIPVAHMSGSSRHTPYKYWCLWYHAAVRCIPSAKST
jgi:hypothetical protein